ncbi:organic cation/carnitine transporter 7-like [Sitophilus oryzae]|uniref:Organic cation/carnitine transporter 7-like n=1 Tax=Sitophilus oryzae TaxID=7048 RepID=A0A6J2X3K4_SITOR|nr:organic cation/carnitine transporter 7-like [Sitophilus oryzae]
MSDKKLSDVNTIKEYEKMILAGPADFQTAIAASGFGKFNIVLLLLFIPLGWTLHFEALLISFVVPAASCDLNMTPYQKGVLNSMSFFGMAATGLVWGFLLDTLGRRKVMLYGYIIESLAVIGAGLSSNFYLLSAFKFLGGAIAGGAYVGLSTYLHEFHGTKYRSKVQMILASVYASGSIVMPLLASAILPLKIQFKWYFIELHSWNVLILVTASLPIMSVLAIAFLPETPIYLMSSGDNDGAMDIFRTIYYINTGKRKESYPIQQLIEEIQENKEQILKESRWQRLKSSIQQVAPLYGSKHRNKLILACAIQGLIQLVINVIYVIMPQIFQATHEYQHLHNGTDSTLCNVLDLLRSPNVTEEIVECSPNLDSSFTVYLSAMIMVSVSVAGYAFAGTVINFTGRKKFLYVMGFASAIVGNCMYFSNSETTTLILSSLYLATANLCFDTVVTDIVVIFPTSLRAMALSMSNLTGRALTVVGSTLFPFLVELGCAPPFVTYGCLILAAILLSILVPSTDNMDIK